MRLWFERLENIEDWYQHNRLSQEKGGILNKRTMPRKIMVKDEADLY